MATDPLVVHVLRLRRSPGLSWHEVRSGSVDGVGPLNEEGIDPFRSVVPAEAECEADVNLRSYAGGIEVTGHVSAPWVGICRRCTAPVQGSLRIAVKERFVDPPVPEDEMYPIVDDTIDLEPLMRDAIVLELPAAPLCRQDCAGLCPQCGADQNEGPCGCVAPRDPRWANLDVLR